MFHCQQVIAKALTTIPASAQNPLSTARFFDNNQIGDHLPTPHNKVPNLEQKTPV